MGCEHEVLILGDLPFEDLVLLLGGFSEGYALEERLVICPVAMLS